MTFAITQNHICQAFQLSLFVENSRDISRPVSYSTKESDSSSDTFLYEKSIE